MYGMVIQGARDLLITQGGDDLWERVLEHAGLSGSTFAATTTYDDAVVYGLVESAAAVTGLEQSEVLRALGRHWVLYTGSNGWDHLFDVVGNDLRSFVASLDAMHLRLETVMPEMRAPSFAVSSIQDGQLEVIYRSEREHLAPMVLGLLEGLAELFGESWNIAQTAGRSDSSAAVFLLTEHAAVAAGEGVMAG